MLKYTLFISFSCWIALYRTFSTRLNRSDERVYLLFPILSENDFFIKYDVNFTFFCSCPLLVWKWGFLPLLVFLLSWMDIEFYQLVLLCLFKMIIYVFFFFLFILLVWPITDFWFLNAETIWFLGWIPLVTLLLCFLFILEFIR